MKFYELTYLITPSDLSEEEVNVFSEKINSFIQEQGGVLDKISKEKKKRLAYPIKKRTMAFLKTLTFNLNPEKLPALEKSLKENKGVLRYLILAKPRPKEKKVVSKPPTIFKKKVVKEKVELKDIEKKLEEILEE